MCIFKEYYKTATKDFLRVLIASSSHSVSEEFLRDLKTRDVAEVHNYLNFPTPLVFK